MVSIFGKVDKLFRKHYKCSIEVSIESIVSDVQKPYEVSIQFERGPQTDESGKYQLKPKERKVVVNKTFTRTSSFTYAKKEDKWYEKECKLTLFYFEGDSKKTAGVMKVNLGEMVDKSDVTRSIEFKLNKNPVETVSLRTTFLVISGAETTSSDGRKSSFLVSQRLTDSNSSIGLDDVLRS